MTESGRLELGYRRLLAWYPQPFRSEQGEEMLAVLMASAPEGQRRPRPAEAVDVIRSALGMRVRSLRSQPANRDWSDALALFSLLAPLSLLMADILEVALPYRLPPTTGGWELLRRGFGTPAQISGLPLLSQPGFDIAVGGQVIIAAVVLLGLRRMALAATAAAAVSWIVVRYWIPAPLQVLATAVYLLEAAALIASPGPRRGRHLVNWGHGVVLLVVAAAVQVSTLVYAVTGPPVGFLLRQPSDAVIYLVISLVLTAAAVTLTVVLRVNWYVRLLLAVMFYPYAIQVAFSVISTRANGFVGTNLIGYPTPSHLALLYLPPVLLACAAITIAVTPRRSAVLRSPGPDKTDVA
jgi:hypothetical protein